MDETCLPTVEEPSHPETEGFPWICELSSQPCDIRACYLLSYSAGVLSREIRRRMFQTQSSLTLVLSHPSYLLNPLWGQRCVLFYRSCWTALFWCLQYYLVLEIANFLDLSFPFTFGKERLTLVGIPVCYTGHEVFSIVCFGSYWRVHMEEVPSSLQHNKVLTVKIDIICSSHSVFSADGDLL